MRLKNLATNRSIAAFSRASFGFFFLLMVWTTGTGAEELTLSETVSVQDPPEVSVIANLRGAPEHLSMETLRSIFRGEQSRWADGTRIVIVLDQNGEAAADAVYEMSLPAVRRFWMEKVFRGEASAPETLQTEDEVVRWVASTPGTIAVVSRSTYETARYVSIGTAPAP